MSIYTFVVAAVDALSLVATNKISSFIKVIKLQMRSVLFTYVLRLVNVRVSVLFRNIIQEHYIL